MLVPTMKDGRRNVRRVVSKHVPLHKRAQWNACGYNASRLDGIAFTSRDASSDDGATIVHRRLVTLDFVLIVVDHGNFNGRSGHRLRAYFTNTLQCLWRQKWCM